MKQVKIFFTAASIFLLSSASFATLTKIGVVDMQKVMQSTPKMKALQQRLEKDFMPRRDKLVKMEEQLKVDMEKFKRDSAVMSDSEKKELQSKIMQTRQSFEKEGQAYQKDLSEQHNKSVQALYEKVKTIVDSIAQKGQYDLVLQKDAAPYSASKLDITDQVLAKLK